MLGLYRRSIFGTGFNWDRITEALSGYARLGYMCGLEDWMCFISTLKLLYYVIMSMIIQLTL